MNKKFIGSLIYEYGIIDQNVSHQLWKLFCIVFKDYNLSYLKFIKKHFDKELKSCFVLVKSNENEIIAGRCVLAQKAHGKILLQNCETAVLEKWRGQKIFLNMTKIGMDFSSEYYQSSSFINFPNSLSLKGYLKLGYEHILLYKGILIPRIWQFSLLKKALTQENDVSLKYSVYKKSLFLIQIEDYNANHNLNVFAIQAFFRGKIVVYISCNKGKGIDLTRINCVSKNIPKKFIQNHFKPNWIDTIKYG